MTVLALTWLTGEMVSESAAQGAFTQHGQGMTDIFTGSRATTTPR